MERRKIKPSTLLWASAAIALGATPTLAATPRPARAARQPQAHSARSIKVDDTGHLSLLKAFGSVLVERGYAKGTLPGQANVRMTVASSVTASFSIRAAGGTIYGHGSASLHSGGRYASFGGSLSVSSGSGRYAHAHGSGKLYGVIDRRTHAVTVQTVGTLSY
jgi:hypothetical protein